MRIHREGLVTIVIVTLLLIMAVIASNIILVNLILKILIVVPFIALFFLIIWFFRIPNRIAVTNDNLVFAPADGKVVVIEKTNEGEYFKDERIQVSIFMSPLNVHQNTYPISGTVVYTQYHKGKYLVAWHPKSSILNERSTVVIRHNSGKEILMRQIAGAVARRICTYSKPNDEAEQGKEMGFIKFGSRVDLFLPIDSVIDCKLNQISYGRQTVIARLNG
jgi:phosphatidylserine decarboxylase